MEVKKAEKLDIREALLKNASQAAAKILFNGQSAVINQRLTLEAFSQLAGEMSGYPFVKVVVDRETQTIHFIEHSAYPFHADYIAEKILGVSPLQVRESIDEFNKDVYQNPQRRFCLGVLALHKRGDKRFFSLETVEIDNMGPELLLPFYGKVKEFLDPVIPLLFKPANHEQESTVMDIDPVLLPRVLNHELFASANYIPLNPGRAQGRLRVFRTEEAFQSALPTIEWFDIIVMERVPDSIPRVAGIINDEHTTPLSHTNVLAHGWQIPNSIQIGVIEEIEKEGLNGRWVQYVVDKQNQRVGLSAIEKPAEVSKPPAWSVQQIALEVPEVKDTSILELSALRMTDRFKYGTKAANLGELIHVLQKGSPRLVGYYRVPRPPRPDLMPFLAKFLGLSEKSSDLQDRAWEYLAQNVKIPRGIAIPFSVQQMFLESSPRIQQAIGKLKMALELDAREIDSLCLVLQKMIRATRISDEIRDWIDAKLIEHMAGVSSFVVRSSSNAEDLENFSAAGIYESINHVSSAEKIFEGIKEVWASLISPRSVRLRKGAGISLDDTYMGIIIQEEIKAEMGGVLVTANPLETATDFRNVYLNVSLKSVNNVVQGDELPYQFLFNTVEGGGRTVSLGTAKADLSKKQKAMLQRLAFVGRLLQSHFSPDYTFQKPMDIEWATQGDRIMILQLRPYGK